MTLSSDPMADPVTSIPHAAPDVSLTDADPDSRTSSSAPSRSGSASEQDGSSRREQLEVRPKLHTRKSSGTIIVSRDAGQIEIENEYYDEGDARTMSPRRSSEEVDRLEEGLREQMIEQSRQLQATLLSLVERVESVKAEHDKLEGGNRFLQSYIGELMSTSRITATGLAKGKGKVRMTK